VPIATVDDVRLHYRFDGPVDAPVVMLSNSLGTELAMWDPQVAALAADHRVLRYDARGHGLSTVASGPYTIERLARDALGLLDALAIERVRFCGLSMGGMVGQWLGVNASQRIARLVLCNTAARIGPLDLWNTRIENVRKGGMAAIVDAVLARWFTPAFNAASPEAVERTRAMLLRAPPDGYIACCEAIRDMDQCDAIAAIGVPTLVIAGTHDISTPPADGHFLAERIQRAQYVELAAAHLSNIEAAPAFNQALTRFLSAP
jgi:3-oxoadipate enol-lactonase